MRLRRCGERAVLVETDDVLGWYTALTDRPLPRMVEAVPAATTLLVRFTGSVDIADVRGWLSDRAPGRVAEVEGDPLTVPVRYDGADLDEVAELTGLSTDEVVALHSGAEYTVAFTGFAPGFGYLKGLDDRLRLPRRDTPRTRVPAGAVGVAGEFTGVYPRPSPGGWRLLGTTSVSMWDAGRVEPALLRPGVRVRFEPVSSLPDPATREPDGGEDGEIEVVRCGPLGTVQDLGRPGYASLGVSASGAADPPSATLANRLVGNVEGAAVLELSFGATLRFHASSRVAVTGATAEVSVDGRAEGGNAPFSVAAGQTVTIGPSVLGLRSYVAVRGGIGVPPVLGSRSTDVLSGLGPAPLRAGRTLPVGDDVAGPPPAVDLAPVAGFAEDEVVVRVTAGPRDDWFSSFEEFLDTPYTVTAESNRVGVRLSGAPLPRVREGELPSEGMVAGAVQVPPGGTPIVFLADHPVTGGYPVIAVVCAADLPLLAQARPGQKVRFTRSGMPRRSGVASRRGT